MSLATTSPPYKEALRLQKVMLRDAENENTPPSVKAQLARAWKEIESLKRVMRGLPANTSQSIRSEAKPKKSRSSVGPLEPVQVEPRTIEPEPAAKPTNPEPG